DRGAEHAPGQRIIIVVEILAGRRDVERREVVVAKGAGRNLACGNRDMHIGGAVREVALHTTSSEQGSPDSSRLIDPEAVGSTGSGIDLHQRASFDELASLGDGEDVYPMCGAVSVVGTGAIRTVSDSVRDRDAGEQDGDTSRAQLQQLPSARNGARSEGADEKVPLGGAGSFVEPASFGD